MCCVRAALGYLLAFPLFVLSTLPGAGDRRKHGEPDLCRSRVHDWRDCGARSQASPFWAMVTRFGMIASLLGNIAGWGWLLINGHARVYPHAGSVASGIAVPLARESGSIDQP